MGSCCHQLSWPRGNRGSGGHGEEREERDEGVQTQATDGRTRPHPPSGFPVLTLGGTDVPLASDIFICSEPSRHREGDPRDAPEQIFTSSEGAFDVPRSEPGAVAPPAGPAPSMCSVQRVGSGKTARRHGARVARSEVRETRLQGRCKPVCVRTRKRCITPHLNIQLDPVSFS